MKYLITIKDAKSKIIFKGKPINLPIKKDAISELCMELFSDDDPCIIHQSFAVKKLGDKFLSFFTDLPISDVSLQDYQKRLSFVDIDLLERLTLTIEVK